VSKGDQDERRLEVFKRTLKGESAAKIAEDLGVSPRTIHRDRVASRDLLAEMVESLAHSELLGEHLAVLEVLRAECMGRLDSCSDVAELRKLVEVVLKVQRAWFEALVTVGAVARVEIGGDQTGVVDGLRIATASKTELATVADTIMRQVREMVEGKKGGKVQPMPRMG